MPTKKSEALVVASDSALSAEAVPSGFRYTLQGVIVVRLEIDYGPHQVVAETFVHAICWAALKAQKSGLAMARVPAALLRFACPWGAIEDQDHPLLKTGMGSSHTCSPGWLNIPLALLTQAPVGGKSLLEEILPLFSAKDTPLTGMYDSSGQHFCGVVAPASPKGAVIMRISEINIADMSAQSPSEDFYAFDPDWEISYLGSHGTSNKLVAHSITAGDHFLETLRTAQEVERAVNALFRAMSKGQPPVVSADLREKLERVGNRLSSWDEGALAGHKNAVEQLQGKPCSLYVPIPMLETLSCHLAFGEITAPPRRAYAAFAFLPIRMAEEIAVAAYRAGWKKAGSLPTLDQPRH